MSSRRRTTGQPGLEPGIAGFGDRCLSQLGHCPRGADRNGHRARPKRRRPMRAEGLEPPRAEAHQDLNLARIPIPPRPRGLDSRRRAGCRQRTIDFVLETEMPDFGLKSPSPSPWRRRSRRWSRQRRHLLRLLLTVAMPLPEPVGRGCDGTLTRQQRGIIGSGF